MSTKGKYRLVTRSDFDGLVCAVLLKDLGLINDIQFVHPKDMQDGKVAIMSTDITTNLPYVSGCHLAFDHHASEAKRNEGTSAKNHIIDPSAPSAARVVYNYYGGKNKFPGISDDLMIAVDKADSAQFSRDEIMFPRGWALLNYLMDARTGLGRFREFRISNYQLMMDLIDYCKGHSIEEILRLPDVKERVDLYFQHEPRFREQLQRCSKVHKNLVVLDLRNEDPIYAGNRFLIYALYPECNISMHVMWGLKKQNVAVPIGKSILNKTSKVNVGDLCLKYGGGGHENAGTCQIETPKFGAVLKELIDHITRVG